MGIGGTDINALHVLDSGDLVMSFNATSFSVPGLTGGPNGTTVELPLSVERWELDDSWKMEAGRDWQDAKVAD